MYCNSRALVLYGIVWLVVHTWTWSKWSNVNTYLSRKLYLAGQKICFSFLLHFELEKFTRFCSHFFTIEHGSQPVKYYFHLWWWGTWKVNISSWIRWFIFQDLGGDVWSWLCGHVALTNSDHVNGVWATATQGARPYLKGFMDKINKIIFSNVFPQYKLYVSCSILLYNLSQDMQKLDKLLEYKLWLYLLGRC